MALLNKVFTNMDFHLNTNTKTLKIQYGQNTFSIYLSPQRQIRISSDFQLGTPSKLQTTIITRNNQQSTSL